MFENNSFDLAIIFLPFFREKSDLNSDLKDIHVWFIEQLIQDGFLSSFPPQLNRRGGFGTPCIRLERFERNATSNIGMNSADARQEWIKKGPRGKISNHSWPVLLKAFSRFAGQRLDLLVRGNSDSPALYIHVHAHVGEKVYPVYRSMYNRAIILAGTSPGYAWSS